jgi:hypothetical protein
MAQTKKPVTRSKAVVGSSKKSQGGMKLGRRGMLVALVGILSFAVIVGIGWQQWQDHQLKAHAYGWTTTTNVSLTRKANYLYWFGPFPTSGSGTYRLCFTAKSSSGSGLSIYLNAEAHVNSIINTGVVTYCSGADYLNGGTSYYGAASTTSTNVTLTVTSAHLEKYITNLY